MPTIRDQILNSYAENPYQRLILDELETLTGAKRPSVRRVLLELVKGGDLELVECVIDGNLYVTPPAVLAKLQPDITIETSTAPSSSTTVRDIPLGKLIEGDNPRRTSDAAALSDLAQSIGELGILQPLLVRPCGAAAAGGYSQYQVVAGHRRLHAARMAGLSTVPCVVRVLDAELARACAIVENLQRENLEPLDEADAVEQLPWTEAEIAARLGRTPKWVKGRLSIATSLHGSFRELLAVRRIGIGAAILLASLPHTRQQQLADTDLSPDALSYNKTPVSWDLARVRSIIAGRRVEYATWGHDDDTLGGRGACTACPVRTACQRELWGDSSVDEDLGRCLDPECWTEKLEAWCGRLRAAGMAMEGDRWPEHGVWLGSDRQPTGHEETWRQLVPEVEVVWHLGGTMPQTYLRNDDVREALADRPELAALVPEPYSSTGYSAAETESDKAVREDRKETITALRKWARTQSWDVLAPLVAATLAKGDSSADAKAAQKALVKHSLRNSGYGPVADKHWLEAAGLVEEEPAEAAGLVEEEPAEADEMEAAA